MLSPTGLTVPPMRNLLFGFGLAVLGFISIAMAAPPIEKLVEGQQRINGELVIGGANTPVRMKGTVFLDTLAPNPQAYTASTDGGVPSLSAAQQGLQQTSKCVINYDLPAASASNVALGTICQDTATCTISNCPFGSQLLLGVDQVLAAGPGTLTPYLSGANTAFVRGCAQMDDAGTFNMPDASYVIRCMP